MLIFLRNWSDKERIEDKDELKFESREIKKIKEYLCIEVETCVDYEGYYVICMPRDKDKGEEVEYDVKSNDDPKGVDSNLSKKKIKNIKREKMKKQNISRSRSKVVTRKKGGTNLYLRTIEKV